MAIEKKELYIVSLEDGRQANAVVSSFTEVEQLFGSENITKIEKLPYEEPAEEA